MNTIPKNKPEIAERLNVSEPRIHGDISGLRTPGIEIHSRKKRYRIDCPENTISRLIKRVKNVQIMSQK